MSRPAFRYCFPLVPAGFVAATFVLLGPMLAAAQQKPPVKKVEPVQRSASQADVAPRAPTKGGQAIVALVNDEPITAYEVEQRTRLLGMNANIGDRVKENFKRLVQADGVNQQMRAILDQIVQANPGKTREQILAIFEERKKQFALGLQKQAIDSARASVAPTFRKEAQEELIEEKLKLQEAKRLGIEITDDELKRIMKGIGERNKMNEEQFAQHLKGMGVDSTMKDRFKASVAWREVVRRKFAMQISITQKEVDRMISASAGESGDDTVELQLHKLTLTMPGKMDQAAMARRYTEAESLRRKLSGCKNMASAAQGISDVKFDDLKYVKPSAIVEPTRSMLLNAKDGDILPPTTASAGIEIYAVCGRRAVKGDETQRTKAQEELQAKEYEILAKRHLRDLRQDALIEFR